MGITVNKAKVSPSSDKLGEGKQQAATNVVVNPVGPNDQLIVTTDSVLPTNVVVSPKQNVEEVYIVWLGNIPVNNSKSEEELKHTLGHATSSVRVFQEPKKGLKFIESIAAENAIVMMNFDSDETIDRIRKQLEPKMQVDTVWIMVPVHNPTKKNVNCSKIKYFNSLDDATITLLSERIRIIIRQTLDFNIFDRAEQRSTRDLTRNSAAFLWFQMLLNVLRLMPGGDSANEEMLELCDKYYRKYDDQTELENIQKYRETYKSDDAIYWYTKNCFLYKRLNNALRTENIYLLRKFGTYIVDLCVQIEKLYKERREAKGPEIITLYRGQYISRTELKQMREKINGIFSTNGFLSTTVEHDVATDFIKKVVKSTELLPILFEITASTDLKNVAFADITHLSDFPVEKETLFRLGAVFRIDAVENHATIPNLFVVKITATDDGYQTVKNYNESSKHDLEGGDENVLLGRLLIDMGQYKEAKTYFCELIESVRQTKKENDIKCAPLYHNLGRVHACMGELHEAHRLMTDALNIRINKLPNDDPAIAHTLNSVGIIEGEMAQYTSAKLHFEKALSIFSNAQDQQKDGRRSQLRIASTKTNMGWIYYLQGDYSGSEAFHTQALNIRKTHLDEEDPLIADNWHAIGALHHRKGQYKDAKKWYTDALNVREKKLPDNHPAIANSYQSLGSLELENGQYDRARTHYEKALHIFNETLSADHLMIAGSYKSIGSVFLEKGEHDKALDYFKNAFTITTKSLSDNHPLAGECYHYMGMVYERKGLYDEAIRFYKRTLDCTLGAVPIEHPSIAKIHSSLANAYLRNGNLILSEEYFMKCYKTQEKIYPNKHPDLVLTLNNLGALYTHKNEYIKGEQYLQSALTMCIRHFPDNQTALSRIYFNLGELKCCDEKYDAAIKHYEDALKVRDTILPNGDLSVADIHVRLGYAYFNKPDYTQAEMHFKFSRNIYKKTYSAGHPDLRLVERNIELNDKALQELATDAKKKP